MDAGVVSNFRPRAFAAGLALSVFALAAPAQELPRPPIALTHANVLDVKTGKVTSNATVVLRGGKIESIAAGAAAPTAKGPGGHQRAGGQCCSAVLPPVPSGVPEYTIAALTPIPIRHSDAHHVTHTEGGSYGYSISGGSFVVP